MTTIPRMTNPDSGLYFRYPNWNVIYYEDSKTRIRSLGTDNIETARELRDQLYAKLIANGATQKGERGRPLGKHPYIYIYYQVRVPGQQSHNLHSMEEAIALRDALLENEPKP